MTHRNFFNHTALLIVDIVALISLFYASGLIRVALSGEDIPLFNSISLADFVFIIFIILFFMHSEKIYTFRYDFWQESKKILKSLFLSYLMALTLLALMKTNLYYSRLFITIYFALAMVWIPIIKRIAKRILYTFNGLNNGVLVLGEVEQVELFKKEFQANFYLGQHYSSTAYDSVIIVSKGMSKEVLDGLIARYLNQKGGLYLVPYVTDINFVHSNIMEYSNIRYNSIHIENRLLIRRNLWIKDISDKLVTFMILPFFLLLHGFITLAIKLDSKGAIFFKQPRLGKGNHDFLCYKYRTMFENSEHLLQAYLKEHPEEVSHYQIYHKYKNDPRITKVGHVLRATSLDELPQILNILKGEMSLVGPRPYMLNESAKLANHQEFILKVKPGITGLWQVSGRNNLTFKERNELEVWYIKNWFLWDDFVILIKTIKVVLMKIGAK